MISIVSKMIKLGNFASCKKIDIDVLLIAINNPHFPFLGDGAASQDHIENGHPSWGYGIIGLMFLPNLVFVLWLLVGTKKKLHDGKRSTINERWQLLTKILVAGSVQLVTIIK